MVTRLNATFISCSQLVLSYMNIATSLSLYESCKSWHDGLKSESTKKAYSVHVSLFCRFHHTNPDELVRLKPEELKDMVIKYVLELRNRVKIPQASQKEERYQLIASNFILWVFSHF